LFGLVEPGAVVTHEIFYPLLVAQTVKCFRPTEPRYILRVGAILYMALSVQMSKHRPTSRPKKFRWVLSAIEVMMVAITVSCDGTMRCAIVAPSNRPDCEQDHARADLFRV
jgi:hypothetical protein